MNRFLKQELRFWIKLLLAYIGLGFGSALIAVWVSIPFSGWVRPVIMILVFASGFVLIEIKVEKTSHEERDP